MYLNTINNKISHGTDFLYALYWCINPFDVFWKKLVLNKKKSPNYWCGLHKNQLSVFICIKLLISGQFILCCSPQRASSHRSLETSCWNSCSLTGEWRGGRRYFQVRLHFSQLRICHAAAEYGKWWWGGPKCRLNKKRAALFIGCTKTEANGEWR